MSQLAKLLNRLESAPITQLQAFNELGICRLSERCRELERLGFVIEHKSIKVPARDGKTATVTQYTLLARPEQWAA